MVNISLILVDDDVLQALVEADPFQTSSSFVDELEFCSKTIGNHFKNMEKGKKLDKNDNV